MNCAAMFPMKQLLVLLISFFTFNSSIHAFDTKGHKYLEQEAYKLLRNYPNGQAIIDWLVQNKILVEGLPSRSQYPDNALERQFTQSRQGYHFMTSNFNVLEAARSKGNLPAQEELLLRSLGPSLQMIYFFFREIIENPSGASQAGRGIYVLMHIVADSYSTEHTSRDSTNAELLTIKGWKISRLVWPKAARAKEPGGKTLLLLHHGKPAPGDRAWFYMNGQDTVLTAAGKNAAKAMCDLLVITYEASKQPSRADEVLCNYFEKYLKPYQSTVSNKTFLFAGTSKNVRYNFGDNYEADKKAVIFHYDRSPFYSLMLTVQSGFSTKELFNTFGAEIERYVSPRAADKAFALIRRTPVGYGLGVVYINNHPPGATFAAALRFKAFMSFSFALPLLNASFDPHGGISVYPAASATHFSPHAGVDLVWNPGNDWYFINSHARTIRLTLGYEYDPWNVFLQNSIKLKIGYNTWHSRIVTRKGTGRAEESKKDAPTKPE